MNAIERGRKGNKSVYETSFGGVIVHESGAGFLGLAIEMIDQAMAGD